MMVVSVCGLAACRHCVRMVRRKGGSVVGGDGPWPRPVRILLLALLGRVEVPAECVCVLRCMSVRVCNRGSL